MWKQFFQALFQSRNKYANQRAIAKHLAYVSLYEFEKEDALYPDVKQKYKQLEKRMAELGKSIYMVSGYRTAKRQNVLYDQGRKDNKNIVTNAKGLQSYHNYCLAFDVAFIGFNWNPPSSDWWGVLGQEGKKLGLIWGGDWKFKDVGHFQWQGGHGNPITWEKMKPWFDISHVDN